MRMSGGRWGYKSFALAETAEEVNGIIKVAAETEHQLDWGMSGDTCLDCAKLRVASGWIAFFDGSTEAAIALMRDKQQNLCARDQEKIEVGRKFGVV